MSASARRRPGRRADPPAALAAGGERPGAGEHLEHGSIKLVTTPGGRILGADIVAPGAGEMIHFWTLAVKQRLKIGAVAGMIAPYPTLSEIGKRAAGNFFLPKLFSDRSRRLVRLLARLG
jgi:Pyruvate/2-oxoglutarate dehydrogenase complex, dihydrolipoamide dehydrogenase (E3) component, and related enzymes